MKKMLLATALALLITGCVQQTFTVQNKPRSSSTKGTITHHFVSELKKKLSMQPKICEQKMLAKTETQQTFVNGLLGFITLAFILRWKRVCIVIGTVIRAAHR